MHAVNDALIVSQTHTWAVLCLESVKLSSVKTVRHGKYSTVTELGPHRKVWGSNGLALVKHLELQMPRNGSWYGTTTRTREKRSLSCHMFDAPSSRGNAHFGAAPCSGCSRPPLGQECPCLTTAGQRWGTSWSSNAGAEGGAQTCRGCVMGAWTWLTPQQARAPPQPSCSPPALLHHTDC